MSRRTRKPNGKAQARPLMTTLHAAERALPLPLRPWLPFERTVPRDLSGTPRALGEHETFWANAHYLVHRTEFRSDGVLGCVHLSMRTVENDTRHDWREMMRVKDELCGPDWEGVELYPAADRVVDTANQYHLFCFPPGGVGFNIMREIGFNAGRHVYGPDDEIPEEFLQGQGTGEGSTQRPLDSNWEPKVTLPFGSLPWYTQVVQYPTFGTPGFDYFAGDVSEAHPGKPPIDCLLFRDDDGMVRGILNHYPVDYPPLEKAGNVNLWVDPERQRLGIGTDLWNEAVKRWNVRLEQQRFTPEGAAWARRYIGGRHV